MNRRNFFLNSVGSALSASLLTGFSFDALMSPSPSLKPGENLRDALIQENDRGLRILLDRQEATSDHFAFGGIPTSQGLYHAMSAAVFIQRIASAYIEPSSTFYQAQELELALDRALTFLNNAQHADGTIDLITTNFHSTPDTAFVVEPLCLGYLLMKDKLKDQDILGKWERFLSKAGEALSVGGIHTPNHRWVVCMALARLNSLFPTPAYLNRIEEWVGEGIDIDPDGQYTEKSTHVYSPLTNRCLITMARLLDREEFLDPVRRNLEMTLYYLHPDDTVVTEASRRQDQYQKGTLQNYYYPYLFMALKAEEGRFATLADRIPRRLPLSSLVRNLAYLQEDETLFNPLPPSVEPPTNFSRSFPHSQLVRIRRDQWDATLLAENATFLTFQHGAAILQGMRIASAFFGKGQFRSESLEETESGFILRQILSGPYYQPFPRDRLPEDGNWEKMPRSMRPQSEVQELEAEIRIEEMEQGLRIAYEWKGTAGVPVCIELGFAKDGNLSGVSTLANQKEVYLLEGERGVYRMGKDAISFGPGSAIHSWTQLRGALPKLNANSVYITGYTPFSGTLEIKAIQE